MDKIQSFFMCGEFQSVPIRLHRHIIFKNDEIAAQYANMLQAKLTIVVYDVRGIKIKESGITLHGDQIFHVTGIDSKDIIRDKIEGSFEIFNDAYKFADHIFPDKYFEFHCKVTSEQFNHLSSKYPAAVSNWSKNIQQPDKIFINFRAWNLDQLRQIEQEMELISVITFDAHNQTSHNKLKSHHEFVIFDSNPELEQGWLK